MVYNNGKQGCNIATKVYHKHNSVAGNQRLCHILFDIICISSQRPASEMRYRVYRLNKQISRDSVRLRYHSSVRLQQRAVINNTCNVSF